MQTSLQNAKLSWNDAGAPVSDSFEDVYFSNDNGLQETRYVFLKQNNLPERWLTHDRSVFVIAETGFGTGLNFLATWQAFRQQKQAAPETKVSRLHFISFEKFPLTRQDLQRVLCAWPELTEFSESLIAAYPAAIPGCQRLRFDQGSVILDLWFGDVNDLLPQVYSPHDGLVDAWYLDGFAPSKNPDMWSENLFTQLYRLIRPQGTLATFTAAGFVRRGLTAAGFEMAKMPGHGKKREMLFGRSQKTPRSPLSAPNSVAIVGGGIASAWLSYLLTQRGYQVVLFCADHDVAQAASGNPQGAIYPLLHKPTDLLSQFFSAAFHYCRQLIHEVHSQSPIAFDWCGVLLKAFDEKSSQRIGELLATHFPPELIHAVTDGALFPQGGWVIPDELTHTLFQLAAATGLLTQHFNCEITAIHEQQGSWCLSTAADESYLASVLILANGAEVSRYQQTQSLPITPFRGQISSIEAVTDKENATPVVCGDGYILPARNGQQVIGATYIRNDTDRSVRDSEHQENKVKMQRTLAVNSSSHRIIDGRAAIRGVTRNHFPVVGGLRSDAQLNNELTQHSSAGGLPDMTSNLLIFAGLGSRGLCSAPLAAEILISLLLQEPVPCSLDILRELDPQRRQLKPLWRKQYQKSVRSNTRI
jgi:tRNA U-34 5-methylaminomethyl-2-thiouridine biosynthesis protein MnmC, C-terminal domain